MRERERDPKRAVALARARQRLAKKLEGASSFSLTALRLSKGVSQAKLAAMIDTQQPAIARIEKGDVDLMFSTIEKIAKALDVSIGEVCTAVQATRTAKLESTHQNG
jgi:DNA-binding XRE family transcriptional regulator